MKNYSTGFALLLLLVTGLLVALFGPKLFQSAPNSERKAVDEILQGADGSPEEGERKPGPMKERVKDPVCKSNCEAVARTCRSLAEGVDARAACDKELTRCLGGCS